MSASSVILVGAGRMGAVHASVIASQPTTDLVAVVDVDLERAAAVAGNAAVHESLSAATEATGARLAVIATSTASHASLVREAIDLEMSVLCEKPLTLAPGESRELGAIAADAGVHLQIGFWRRYSPLWAQARALIAEDAIGEPVFLRLSQWDADPPPPEFCDPAVSGGLMVDCGIHEFDLAEWLTGRRVISVLGRNLTVVDPRVGASGDVDNAVAMFELEGDAGGVVDLSRNSRFGDDVRTEILGSRGALFIETIPRGRLVLKDRSGERLVLESADPMRAGLEAQLEAFVAAAAGGGSSGPDAEASARATHLAQSAQKSATAGGARMGTLQPAAE